MTTYSITTTPQTVASASTSRQLFVNNGQADIVLDLGGGRIEVLNPGGPGGVGASAVFVATASVSASTRADTSSLDVSTLPADSGLAGSGTVALDDLDPSVTGTYASRVTVNDGGLFVSVNGSDSNDGLGPGSAKLTLAAAVAALPAGGGAVSLGGGDFSEVPIPLKTGLTLSGRGELTRVMSAGTGDLFTVSGDVRNVQMQNLRLHGTETGGHLFNGTGDFHQSQFLGIHAIMTNPDKSILKAAKLIDTLWSGFAFEGSTGRTVPLVHLVSTSGSMSHNQFQSGRITPGSGAFGFHIEESAVGALAWNNTLSGVNFQVPNDGCLMALSVGGLLVQDVATNDLGTSTQHLFVVGKSTPNSVGSRAATFVNTMRHGGALGSGLVDIDLANCASTTVSNCDNSLFNSTYKIDWHGQYGFYVGIGATHLNAAAISIMGRYGALVSGASTTGNRPAATTYPAGAMYYDTTLGKPIWSNATVWRDAAGTTV